MKNFTVRVKRLVDNHSTTGAYAPCPRRRQRRDKLRPDTMTRVTTSLSSTTPRPFSTTPLISISLYHCRLWSTCSLWSRRRRAGDTSTAGRYRTSVAAVVVSQSIPGPEAIIVPRTIISWSAAASWCEGRGEKGSTGNETNKGRIDKRSAVATWTRILRGE